MRLFVRSIWIAGAILLATVPVTVSPAGQAPILNPLTVWVPPEWHTGGAYTAIQAAPDGRVYLGTTFYEGYARFIVLPPNSQAFQLIAEMASATGERTPGPYAQAKIHTKPAIAPDGKVYFGTKSGKPANDERWQANYPGGHLMVFDPQAGRVTDLGIPRPRQSIMAVGVDPQRNIVYALTDPEVHLITWDPRSRTFADRGAVGVHPPSRYLVVLANGDVYHRSGPEAFNRYTASSGRIERLPLQTSGSGNYEVPYAAAASLDGARFYGVGERSGQVYTFVPGERSITVHFQGAAVPEGQTLPATHYTMTSAPDGNIYYTASYNRGASLYLLRLRTSTGTPEVVGQVGPLPQKPPGYPYRTSDGLMVQGSTAGPDGTVYVMLAYPLRVLVFPRLARP